MHVSVCMRRGTNILKVMTEVFSVGSRVCSSRSLFGEVCCCQDVGMYCKTKMFRSRNIQNGGNRELRDYNYE